MDRIKEKLIEISKNEKLKNKVFEDNGLIFFIIHDGKIIEMSADGSSGPKGGWFPPIVTGPSALEKKAIEQLSEKLALDDDIFQDYWTFSERVNCTDEDAFFYFEDDESNLLKVKELAALINGGQTPFNSLEDFIHKFRKKDIDEGTLYYEWLEDDDDFFIDLWDNIYEYGKPRGTYESFSDDKWLKILDNLSEWEVKPEQ